MGHDRQFYLILGNRFIPNIMMSNPKYARTVHVEVLNTIVITLSFSVAPRTDQQCAFNLFVDSLHKFRISFCLIIK